MRLKQGNKVNGERTQESEIDDASGFGYSKNVGATKIIHFFDISWMWTSLWTVAIVCKTNWKFMYAIEGN